MERGREGFKGWAYIVSESERKRERGATEEGVQADWDEYKHWAA